MEGTKYLVLMHNLLLYNELGLLTKSIDRVQNQVHIVLHISIYILAYSLSCYTNIDLFRTRRFSASPRTPVCDTVKTLTLPGNGKHSTWWVCHRCSKDDDLEGSELLHRAIGLYDLIICARLHHDSLTYLLHPPIEVLLQVRRNVLRFQRV